MLMIVSRNSNPTYNSVLSITCTVPYSTRLLYSLKSNELCSRWINLLLFRLTYKRNKTRLIRIYHIFFSFSSLYKILSCDLLWTQIPKARELRDTPTRDPSEIRQTHDGDFNVSYNAWMMIISFEEKHSFGK